MERKNITVILAMIFLLGACAGMGVNNVELQVHDFALETYNGSLEVYLEQRDTLAADQKEKIDNGFLAVNTALDGWYKAIETRSDSLEIQKEYIVEWTRLVADLAEYGIKSAL